jgi:hypothetical protein
MQRKPWSLRRSRLALLTLLLVLTAIQLGPLAPAASAYEELFLCSPKWAIREVSLGNGITGKEQCVPVYMGVDGNIWDWRPISAGPGNTNEKKDWFGGRTTPPYLMSLTSLIGNGSGGGAAVSKVMIYNPNHTVLKRTIAARVVIQHWVSVGVGAWYTCTDSSWKQASAAQQWMRASLNQYTQPDCGGGSYRALAAGRFWSISLNRWETRGWVVSPTVSLPTPCCVTEPTVTPTPTPDTPD